jgi:putative component of membrane protein insertase Oxa1/YidC/SpoIIIJ protein YidD
MCKLSFDNRHIMRMLIDVYFVKWHSRCVALIFRSMKKIFLKSMLFLILFSLIVSCSYPNSMQAETGWGTDPLSLMTRFYRGPLNHLSAVRYGECPMYPSDSEYSLQSLQKHGMLVGWIMAMDRLMRCGRDETRLSPEVFINGKRKTYDPVGQNDFWWGDK